MTRDQLIALAKNTAASHGLDPALFCGQVERESTWDPWLVRYEPAFRARYVSPLHLEESEEIARSVSYGLMQVMGEDAREFKFAGQLAALCDPALGLEWGAKIMAHKLAVHLGNTHEALESYNGGANPNYADEVAALAKGYG